MSNNAPTVIMLHAHPDDEALLTGGTIARLGLSGVRVVLVFATRGELGEQPPGVLAPGQTLAHRRTAEARWAADVLGVDAVEYLGYRDSGMAGEPTNDDEGAFCRADINEAARDLASIIERHGATTLVAYDDHGGYGHPDHVQVHHVGSRAADLVRGLALYEATINRDHVRRAMAAGSQEQTSADPPDLGPNFGVPEATITHAIDVRSTLDRKRRAIQAHSSQIADTSFIAQLPPQMFEALFGIEWFIEARPATAGRSPIDALVTTSSSPDVA